MTQQTVTEWTRQAWDLYSEQVRDSVVEPDIRSPWRSAPVLVTYVCPFCLHMGSGIDIVAPAGGDSFTATWRDCGHAVSVR